MHRINNYNLADIVIIFISNNGLHFKKISYIFPIGIEVIDGSNSL